MQEHAWRQPYPGSGIVGGRLNVVIRLNCMGLCITAGPWASDADK